MKFNRNQLLCLADYYNSLQGFLQDGYWVLFQVMDTNAFYTKLANSKGKYILITANLLTLVIDVNLNGKKRLVYKVR